jgi:hypothetical protein
MAGVEMTAELHAYDTILRHEVTKRDAMQHMAQYFLEQAGLHQENIDHYTALRNEALGSLGLDNVAVLGSVPDSVA